MQKKKGSKKQNFEHIISNLDGRLRSDRLMLSLQAATRNISMLQQNFQQPKHLNSQPCDSVSQKPTLYTTTFTTSSNLLQ